MDGIKKANRSVEMENRLRPIEQEQRREVIQVRRMFRSRVRPVRSEAFHRIRVLPFRRYKEV